MPPRGHSSSSHSHSSSRSHSSSSRSHSSSSRSRSSSYSSGPARHSSSSHSAIPKMRTRVNQPTGYRPSAYNNQRPISHRGIRHDYIYYPVDWFDEATGKGYRKGYYDENGQYYDDVVFKKNGQYDNVLCKCEYCDTTIKKDWKDGETLTCPNCGAAMKVISNLDEDATEQNINITDKMSADKSTVGMIITVFVFIFICLSFISTIGSAIRHATWQNPGYQSEYSYEETYMSNPEMFGYKLYLKKGDGNSYSISNASSYDKMLEWDDGYESYIDPDTQCYIWYNTDVSPNTWQYWYEDVSYRYESGWMEHDKTGWYIETDAGQWEPLSESVSTDNLWYIQE